MASNSKKRRRVLGASCILAALIIASSSFAWFTSKDEVTNRLSAAANYGVAIAEDFQPPEKFLPGQTVNKDVGAVNTGNVDAFVRMWLGGQMRVVKETSADDQVDAKTGVTTTGNGALTAVTDESKKSVGLNYYDATNGIYYKTLSTEKINNPNDTEAHSGILDEELNHPARYSEVQTVQAGGVLVYAPVNAKYHWNLEQATELPVYTPAVGTEGEPGYVPADTTMTNLEKGTLVGNSASTADGVTKLAPYSTTADDKANYYGAIDASTFKPETSGLYIFRRNVDDTASGTANKYEYSGYYYDATGDKYFALHCGTGDNGKSDYVLPSSAVTENNSAVPSLDQVLPVSVADNSVYLYTASEELKSTTDLTWTYQTATEARSYTPYTAKNGVGPTFYLSGDTWYSDPELTSVYTAPISGSEYTAGTEVTIPAQDPKFTVSNGDANKPIVMDINLANIGTGSEQWTDIVDNTDAYKTTFYYNNDVEEGDTTTKLVDSVELSKNTENGAYLLFDFDLDVFMESRQVTLDEAGKEKTTPVNTWTATTGGNNTGAKPNGGSDDAATYTDSTEIETVGWVALP